MLTTHFSTKGLCAVLLLSVMQSASGASFNCKMAASRMEKIICASGDLSESDYVMSGLYSTLLAAASDKKSLRSAQQHWLHQRDACPDEACIYKMYDERTNFLHKQLIALVEASPEHAERQYQLVDPELNLDGKNDEQIEAELHGRSYICAVVHDGGKVGLIDFVNDSAIEKRSVENVGSPAVRQADGSWQFTFADGWDTQGRGTLSERSKSATLNLQPVNSENVHMLWLVAGQYAKFELRREACRYPPKLH